VGALEAISARIEREGAIRFDAFVDLALYGDGGYFSGGAGAGRRSDFITSPELGPLYGVLFARAVDAEWHRLGRPDPFVVIEGGAGRGALARSILAAGPACLPALRYVCVERSAVLRAQAADLLPVEPPENVFGAVVGGDLDEERVVTGAGPVVSVLDDLPLVPVTGMVIANELLDNLPFRLLHRADGEWHEVHVDAVDGVLRELLVVAHPDDVAHATQLAPAAGEGARIPLQHDASVWVRRAVETVVRGRVVLVDYADASPSLAERPWTEWLRTYRSHALGAGPLEDVGEQDITCEVATDQLLPADVDRPQAAWLRDLGVDDLAAAARAAWEERAHLGDLEAVRARSRVGEADALTDPSGLGAFRVLEWQV
jgi:SAM-dependent MidA family methyltransferase